MIDINRFLDEKQKVKSWPAKKELKVEVLRYVATKFESGRFYTEKEINKIIDEWHTFNDYFLIRRELINNWLLSRTKSGSRYWKEETDKNKDISELVASSYDVGNIESVLYLSTEDDSDSYYILTDKRELIFRSFEQNGAKAYASEMYSTKEGGKSLKTSGKIYCLQKYA